ncbi:1,4-alpha-glucan branching protein GlgB|uniref:1,4-alpha-glucan branching enzyme GlgB n=1 Tax=Dendrosporobacter quercicolus TaxID=146817 RepID=A0A1G9Q548_9FIRM|nr:1,4-alpha-glucan branching protein GlgB [Dendrosporobacter quercicolus]NSL48122.1 1,4-alpha-glucan branching protein GlgB [Dendrosporobacter quercicolus DSM 1736]SDM06126.1 1,4-alpha-glucan branching enzyme [Dendrosporobacter quercicolus]
MADVLLSEHDLYLFHEGTHFRSYQMLGAHLIVHQGKKGVRFAVWAPQAQAVRVVGDFNGWQGDAHAMQRSGFSGVWQLFISGLTVGANYKYEIITAAGARLLKCDPYAFAAELRPATASQVYELSGFAWQDGAWLARREQQAYAQPVLIYEVHPGSWRFNAERQPLSYRELADQLVEYAAGMGFTHIELMPVVEHPFDGSWGYQATGFFAVTSRYGTPQDFMYFINRCHQRGLGVILDWVPGHFCKDDHGLRQFDGSALFESADPLKAENAGWGTTNFDYGRPEVRSFLISNALFWFDVFHIDGLRVDAVANILYLDYCRNPGEWRPNEYGGNGNLAGMELLRKLNEAVFANYPSALMIAEESTSWPLVSKPTYLGGLGFNFKWNMGWMNDMLRYMETDPLHRKWRHNLLTFSFMYAFSENFILPLSHDEVVHGKRSLLDKMPGDYWQKFANLRAFYAYWLAHPGKKLLFMGGEFGQFIEWKYDDSLDWHLLEYPMHRKLHGYVKVLNDFYRRQPALWEIDCDWQGFRWIDCQDDKQSIIAFIRQGRRSDDYLIVICNFTPQLHQGYRIGIPDSCGYREVFNSDDEEFGGSGQSNRALLTPEKIAWHQQQYSLRIIIPPLAVICLQPVAMDDTGFIGEKHQDKL